jgi:hypothetical protein
LIDRLNIGDCTQLYFGYGDISVVGAWVGRCYFPGNITLLPWSTKTMTRMTKTLGWLALALAWLAAGPALATDLDDDLDELVTMMGGSFSSAEQAAGDPDNYWDIRLEMKPIWTDRTDGHWMYVEQAAASSLDKPYRQRVYHVTQVEENLFESAVYALPDPEAAIGAWKMDAPLAQWGPDDLEVRVGCSVFLARQEDGSFQGSTRDKECTSSLRGATYATSEIVIQADRIVSWDRGFNDQDEHVWGAEKSGYVFLKSLPPGQVLNPRME